MEYAVTLFSEASKLFRFIDGFSNQKLVSRLSPPLRQSSHSQVLPKSEVSKLFQTSCQIKKLVFGIAARHEWKSQ